MPVSATSPGAPRSAKGCKASALTQPLWEQPCITTHPPWDSKKCTPLLETHSKSKSPWNEAIPKVKKTPFNYWFSGAMLVLVKVSLHIVLATSYAFSRFWPPRLDRNAQHHLLYAIDVTRHFQGLAFSGPPGEKWSKWLCVQRCQKMLFHPQPSKYTTWPASGETRISSWLDSGSHGRCIYNRCLGASRRMGTDFQHAGPLLTQVVRSCWNWLQYLGKSFSNNLLFSSSLISSLSGGETEPKPVGLGLPLTFKIKGKLRSAQYIYKWKSWYISSKSPQIALKNINKEFWNLHISANHSKSLLAKNITSFKTSFKSSQVTSRHEDFFRANQVALKVCRRALLGLAASWVFNGMGMSKNLGDVCFFSNIFFQQNVHIFFENVCVTRIFITFICWILWL